MLIILQYKVNTSYYTKRYNAAVTTSRYPAVVVHFDPFQANKSLVGRFALLERIGLSSANVSHSPSLHVSLLSLFYRGILSFPLSPNSILNRYYNSTCGKAKMVPPLPCFLGSKPPPTPTTADSGSSFHRQRNRACGKITTLRTVAAAATACLAAATCPPMTEAGALFPAACGSSTVKTGARGTHGGGGGNRRGLQEYATRGCFVLCVTPTSACGEYSSDPTARWRRRQGGCTALKSASGRTRAGAVASQPRGGFVDQRGTLREQFGLRRSADGMGRGGGASPLECRAGMNDGGKPGRVRSRFRRVFDKIRGRVPPPAAAASQDSNTITYDKKV